MAGIEKITNQILAEAQSAADVKKAAYEAQAAKIKEDAAADAQQILSVAKGKAELSQKNAISRAQSSAQLKKRQTVLIAKQKMISELIEKAYHSILAMEDEAYFEMIEKMLDKYMEEGKRGEIYFSQKDLERMPETFEKRISAIAASKDGALTLAKEPKHLDGGFVLVFGGIEENCSIRSLLNAEKEVINDQVNTFLFA